mmetsp:Transcript_40430/g.45182  ORF Transcript_40430/g.45182 Transcript_40430/m.45182 type:complete len:104 (-) Transcript_40430:4178-4489(-)
MPVLLILLTLTYCYHMPTGPGSTEPDIYQSSSSDFSHSEHPILVASKKFHIDTSTSNSKHILPPLKSKSKRSRNNNRHNRNSRHKAYLTNHHRSSEIHTRRYW